MRSGTQTSENGRRDGLFGTKPELSVETTGGVTRVRIDALVIATFDEADEASRRMTMVSLAEGGGFKAKEIAKAFGVDQTRLSQFRRRYADGGAALLLAKHGGKPGPRNLSEGDVARIRAWWRAGKTLDEITAIVNRRKRRAGRSTIGDLVKGIAREAGGLVPSTRDLFPAPVAAEEPARTPPASPTTIPSTTEDLATPSTSAAEAAPELAERAPEVAAIAPELAPENSSSGPLEGPQIVRPCGVAGVMIAHVAIAALGFREALEASRARLRPARTFDLLRTAAVLLFGFFLRYRSVDSLRMLVRDDFGALLGIGRAPEIRTIRRKLREIGTESAGFEGAAMVRSLARSVLASAAAPQGVYFFDDHFKPYHGALPLAKGWDAKRRIGAPGIEDVYVHDMKGRAILFVPLAAPTSLSQAMPQALAELRKAGAETPKLAVFDRGGWSRALFRSLASPGEGSPRIDFLTYLVARRKHRELPIEAFGAVEIEAGGRRRTYELAESALTMRGFERPLRLIVLLDRRKGRQIPILTSDETTPAAELVHLLRARWRQENSFKYLVGELGIDALVSRDMDILTDDREVENPERAALREELAEAEDELEEIERGLGRALATNDEARRPTVRGLKIANADLNHARRRALERIAALEDDIARLPAKVRRADLDPDAKLARPKPRRRVFVNALKTLAHNSEKWLADPMGLVPTAPTRSRSSARFSTSRARSASSATASSSRSRPSTPRAIKPASSGSSKRSTARPRPSSTRESASS